MASDHPENSVAELHLCGWSYENSVADTLTLSLLGFSFHIHSGTSLQTKSNHFLANIFYKKKRISCFESEMPSSLLKFACSPFPVIINMRPLFCFLIKKVFSNLHKILTRRRLFEQQMRFWLEETDFQAMWKKCLREPPLKMLDQQISSIIETIGYSAQDISIQCVNFNDNARCFISFRE